MGYISWSEPYGQSEIDYSRNIHGILAPVGARTLARAVIIALGVHNWVRMIIFLSFHHFLALYKLSSRDESFRLVQFDLSMFYDSNDNLAVDSTNKFWRVAQKLSNILLCLRGSTGFSYLTIQEEVAHS